MKKRRKKKRTSESVVVSGSTETEVSLENLSIHSTLTNEQQEERAKVVSISLDNFLLRIPHRKTIKAGFREAMKLRGEIGLKTPYVEWQALLFSFLNQPPAEFIAGKY